MNVLQYLESVDFEKRTGVFYMRKVSDNKWSRVKVSISPLLIYRIKNIDKERRLNSQQHYVDHVFESKLDGFRYSDSPFCLVRFKPTKESNIPENYVLRCVDEASFVEETESPILHTVRKYKNVFKRAKNYLRYIESETDKRLDDVSWIVNPNLTYIDVALV